MSRQNVKIPPPGQGVTHNVHTIRSFTEQIEYSDFTDGGGATGTYTMGYNIPKGAVILGVQLLLPVAFFGDTATIQFGDGTDVDRYNTGTPDVASAASPEGLEIGVPSGDEIHAATVAPIITVTSGTSFSAFTAGRLIVRVLYAAIDGQS